MAVGPTPTRRDRAGRRPLPLLAAAAVLLAGAAAAQEGDEIRRGEVLFHAAGCDNCHTRKGGAPLAGGVELKTPFGTFRTPNITPDPEHGIGRWTDADFVRALREGTAPDGSPYYPAFPYTTYTHMTDADMLAIKRWIFALVTPAAEPSRPHELSFPYSQRWAMAGWKWLFFEPGPFRPDPAKSEAWNRGAYLVEAVGHCGECHTPRNRFGALERDRWLSGTKDGPDGDKVPNITPDRDTGIGTWSESDIAGVLDNGILPDGDVVGSVMYPIVSKGTDMLSREDRRAIATYLKALPPISNPDAKAVQAK